MKIDPPSADQSTFDICHAGVFFPIRLDARGQRRRSYGTSFISEIMTNSFGLDQSGRVKILGVYPTGEGRIELSACNS
jgi:hypothetical protein